MKRVCVATSTRADWGILRPLAAALRDCGSVELQLLVTNMHLLPAYGNTVDEILSDGFTVDARVPMPDGGDDAHARAAAMGSCLSGTADALASLRPDALVILGDRYEMLAVASAAAVMRVPVIHISGGEISEGAVDDSLRHAITKLASLHLVSAEPYRRRVIQLGEHPSCVVNTGSLGVWNLMNRRPMTREELCVDVGIDPAAPFAVATFHPATLDSVEPGIRCRAMLDALDRFPGINVIITYPNNDAGSAQIIDAIRAYAAERPGRVALVKSLGMHRYLSAVRHSAFVIGNSSSAIIEVPAAGIPAINIGIRQRGRLHSPLVIDCGDSADDIASAIATALNPEFVAQARLGENPYYRPDTLRLSLDAIIRFTGTLPAEPKKFYDLPQ